MRIAALFVALLLAVRVRAATNVWIDTDPSIGPPWREVDDAFALVLAFRSPELRIVGISSTYGNARLPRTTSVARDLVRRCGADVEVYPGASSAREFEAKTAAVAALARAVRAQKLTYVALGPLTNLAAFLRQHPELAPRIDRVIFVGGKSPSYRLAFGRNGWLRIHDANVFKDPEAVAHVLRSGIPLVLAPVEASSDLVLSREEWRQLRHAGSTARFLHAKTRVWITFWTAIVRHPGGPLFDSLAVLLASDPEKIPTRTRSASLHRRELLATEDRSRDSRPVRFATRVTPAARRIAIERLGAPEVDSAKRR